MSYLEKSVLAEALQSAIGERQPTALVFTTHDLDPSFFEGEVLPVFLGDDLKHTRRTREIQLDYEIRERGVLIDVYYEARALAAHEGGGRLGWNRVKGPSKRGGVFHPKVVLALCEDADGAESLVVAISSANLTRGGWWTNVECADIVRLDDGERHRYVSGLALLVDQLVSRLPANRRPATTKVRQFLHRQRGYTQATDNGVLRPTLVHGFQDLTETLRGLFGRRLDGAHLEVVSPFIDADPLAVTSALQRMRDRFSPKSVRVVLPVRQDTTPMSEEVYDAVTESGVVWSQLPSGYLRASGGVEAMERGLHAKVYHWWRAGSDPIDVWVLGSHNLTAAAHDGDTNFEVSVVHETGRGRPNALLDDLGRVPDRFGISDGDLEDDVTDVALVPVTIVYDWNGGHARAIWEGRANATRDLQLLRSGTTVLTVTWLDGTKTCDLSTDQAGDLRKALLTTSLFNARLADGLEGPLLVVEENHDLKPDLLEGIDLTAAEILALWAVPDLRERLRRIAQARVLLASDEDDLELASLQPAPPMSMFDQFAGVFHAFGSLRTRIDAAMDEKNPRRAARAIWSEQLDSPANVLRLAAGSDDVVLAYVTYRCARQLSHRVTLAYPELAEQFPDMLARFDAHLSEASGLRERLLALNTEDAELTDFLNWFDEQFDVEVPA